jgi:hypothetical protein
MARKNDVLMVPWSTGVDWMGVPTSRPSGSLIANAQYELGWTEPDVEWRENEIFSGALRLDGVDRTSPGTHRCIWRSDDGRTYPMFTSDLIDMIMTRGIGKGGLVHERWTVRRAGRHFGLVLAK